MFEGKKVLILGLARSGYEAAKLLAKRNNDIVLNELKKEQNESQIRELQDLGVKLVLGEHPDDLLTKDFDYLIKNPGIRNDHKYVLKANEYNIPVINEVEMAFHLFPEDIDIIGITGTNGKTTTTTIIYEILKRAGKSVHLAGNIGFPVSSFVGKVKSKDIVVTEVSIQQLCNMKNFKTHISVFTNLFEAHLDFVGDYENYSNIKKRIFNHHGKSDYAILNKDNNDLMQLTRDINSTKEYFSSEEKLANGCHLEGDNIIYFGEKVININDIKIKGKHNYENVMAAIMVVKKYGIANRIITEVLSEFKGVEHRIEYVKTINGIEIYNDSKSTNVKATQIALSSFDKPLVLLLGGLDRGHSFEELKDYLKNVKAIIGYGETKNRIKEFAESFGIQVVTCDDLPSATQTAYELAVSGDVILLSPACASWDQFADFEKRGEKFKEYINNLE